MLTVPASEHGIGQLRAALTRALDSDDAEVARLGTARTVVAFCLEGGESAVLLLDRQPPQVADDDEPAEVEIHLSGEQARSFCRGDLNIPLEATEGLVECVGPVRKYLVFDAVLRGRLRRLRGEGS